MNNYEPTASGEDAPPFATHNSGELIWATNYSGFGAAFLTSINIDNFGGSQDYLIDAKLHAKDSFDDPWETKIFLFQDIHHPNKPLPIQPSEIITGAQLFLSDDVAQGRLMPDLDRDTVVLKLTFRSGKKVELPRYMAGKVRQG